MNLSNKQELKTVFITGASRRIGRAIAKTFHQAGYRVVIHCHLSRKPADELMQQLNHERTDSAFIIQQDLKQTNRLDGMMQELLQHTGGLHVLINNASVFTPTNLKEAKLENWDELFTVNVKAPFLLSLAARESLAENQGSIINITDIHADNPLKNYAVYCQSKAALAAQTKSLAKELAPDIRVNGIAPGAIAWPENENQLSVGQQKKIIDKTPLKKHGKPEDIASAALALVNNDFVTGQILAIDGGRSINCQ